MYNLTTIERNFLVDLEQSVEQGIITYKQLAVDMLSAINSEDDEFKFFISKEDDGHDDVFEGYYFVRNEQELNQVYADCVYDSADQDYSKEKKIGSFDVIVRYAYQNADDYRTQSGEDRWHIYIIFKLFN